ncbi:IWS1 [Cordylochernes scorpioides]|uniref:IWS1 n=1 Tax=Cordylochernes scorpioides TaxID=51811 RepID=A0ABY6LNE7_9ARAC|nr:IWS1 [Cordylochernes scorpioides]
MLMALAVHLALKNLQRVHPGHLPVLLPPLEDKAVQGPEDRPVHVHPVVHTLQDQRAALRVLPGLEVAPKVQFVPEADQRTLEVDQDPLGQGVAQRVQPEVALGPGAEVLQGLGAVQGVQLGPEVGQRVLHGLGVGPVAQQDLEVGLKALQDLEVDLKALQDLEVDLKVHQGLGVGLEAQQGLGVVLKDLSGSKSPARSKSGSRSRSGSKSPARSRSGSRSSSRSSSRIASRPASPDEQGDKSKEKSKNESKAASDDDLPKITKKRSRRIIRGDDEDEEDEKPGSGKGSGDEGSESEEEEKDQEQQELIANIFGDSDEGEDFEGFKADELPKSKKKGEKRSKKEASGSDAEGSGPRPMQASDDSEDDDVKKELQKEDFMSDFDIMMQRKKEESGKRRKRKDIDIINDSDDLIAEIITQMKQAAREDRERNKQRQAATRKLSMLPMVVSQLQKHDLKIAFLDQGVLSVMADWLAPLPDKSLPHVKIRESMLKLLIDFPCMDPAVLKASGIGRAVMYLYQHPKEVRANRERAYRLINEWARPIFNLTTNYSSLSKEEREARDFQHMPKKKKMRMEQGDDEAETTQDIDRALAGEDRSLRPGDKGWVGRARVPMPSTKDYVVRPKPNVEMEFTSRMLFMFFVYSGWHKDNTLRGYLSLKDTLALQLGVVLCREVLLY